MIIEIFGKLQNQKTISKYPKFEVSNSLNKKLGQQCSFQKVWKILLSNVKIKALTKKVGKKVSTLLLNKGI